MGGAACCTCVRGGRRRAKAARSPLAPRPARKASRLARDPLARGKVTGAFGVSIGEALQGLEPALAPPCVGACGGSQAGPRWTAAPASGGTSASRSGGSGARRESSAAPALRRANDGRTLRLSKRVRPRGEPPCASSAGLERVGGSWGGAKPGWCEVARQRGIGCRNDPFTSSRTRRGRASMAAPALPSPCARGR